MWYVYELSVEGIIFYIGVTHNPFTRYMQHARSNDVSTHKVTHWILIHNKQLDFKILFHADNVDEALNYEKTTILSYFNSKHKLCNVDYNIGNTLDLPIIGFSPKKRLNKQYVNNIKSYIDQYLSKILTNGQ